MNGSSTHIEYVFTLSAAIALIAEILDPFKSLSRASLFYLDIFHA